MYVRTKLVNGLSFVAKGSTKSEGKEEKSQERNDICALTRLMRVYLDKVPARNRFKSESMPTMKGAKRRCAIVLAAIKFSYKTDVRTLTRINGEGDEKKKGKEKGRLVRLARRNIVSRYDRAFKKVASTRLLWTRDMIQVTCIKRLYAYPRNARKIANAKCMRFMLLANDLSRSLSPFRHSFSLCLSSDAMTAVSF